MCGGILYIMEEILVKNVVIGKQYEMCENYKKFIKISKEKNINIKEYRSFFSLKGKS